MEIRAASRDDAATVHEVVVQAIEALVGDCYSKEQRAAWAAGRTVERVAAGISTATWSVVAVSEGRVVGYASLVAAEVDQLYVHPVVARRGVSRALYEQLERVARASGVTCLSTAASLVAVPVFSAFGFEVRESVTRTFNGADFAVCRMEKHL